MNADRPARLVPKLRFPEFKGAPEWKEHELSKLLPIGSSKRVHQRDWASSGVPFYRAREIVAIHNGEPVSPVHISEELYAENTAKSGEISTGDLLVTGVGSIGVPYLIKPGDRFYFKDGNIIWLKNDESVLVGRFLHLLYQTRYVQSQISTMAGVGTVGTYTIDNANRTRVAFPSQLDEQCWIANCLDSLDNLIAAEIRKLEALRQHKKGLMQQLFPSPGETVPRLRFPEFQDAAQWNIRPLGELAHVIAGQSPSGKNYNTTGNGVPFYQGKADFGDTYLKKPTKWTTQVTKLAQPSDILMSVRAPVGALNISTEQICIGRGLASLQPKCDKWFLYYSLLGQQGRIVGNGGSVFDSINKKQIEELLIPAPPTIAEQQKIADCLGSLDGLIVVHERQIEILRQHKQGLMQQVFPS